MITLAVDTSSAVGSVAIVRDGRPVSEKSLTTLPGHSESLLITIRMMLDSAGLSTGDIGLLAAGTGPGSFTGLRVGLATMKGLHLSTGRPLLGVPSLPALAMNHQKCKAESGTTRPSSAGTGLRVCAAIDARRGDVFAAVYIFGGAGFKTVVEEKMTRPEGLLQDLASLKSEVLCLGDAFMPAQNGGAGPLVGAAAFMRIPAATALHYPSALNTARIAEERFERGEKDDAASLEPRYVRPVDFKIQG